MLTPSKDGIGGVAVAFVLFDAAAGFSSALRAAAARRSSSVRRGVSVTLSAVRWRRGWCFSKKRHTARFDGWHKLGGAALKPNVRSPIVSWLSAIVAVSEFAPHVAHVEALALRGVSPRSARYQRLAH